MNPALRKLMRKRAPTAADVDFLPLTRVENFSEWKTRKRPPGVS